MKFDTIRVVLIATTHPGNIGSTARAMKTMGLNSLYLVSPKSFPHQLANDMAAGADDVLEQVIIVDSLEEAIVGCQWVLGTSARPRGISLSGLTPAECGAKVALQPDGCTVALIFGREHAGLTNEELLRCHYHIHIPSNPDFSSLNLSQAVQIVAYEIRMALLKPKALVAQYQEALAPAEAIDNFYQHLKEVLIEIGFLKPANPKRLFQRLRRLFNRIQLEEMEVNILRGILSHVQNALKWARIKQGQD